MTPDASAAPAALLQVSELPASDWDFLFDAVVERLRRAASGPPQDVLPTLRVCVGALDQLHGLRVREADGCNGSRAELLVAQAALAAARIELARAHAGEQSARHQALHDSLTALPNRSCFRARLDDALNLPRRQSPALAVLFLDLDGFKPINDRHGHAAGDELLRIVAQRLSRSMRADDMVCRLGGDEFACLLADPMGREQLSHVASKLFDAVSAPLQLGPLQFSVRPSIGIAVCPSDGDTSSALLKRADAAMYRAKRRQLGYAFFDRRRDA